jgi:hypothetical protein
LNFAPNFNSRLCTRTAASVCARGGPEIEPPPPHRLPVITSSTISGAYSMAVCGAAKTGDFWRSACHRPRGRGGSNLCRRRVAATAPGSRAQKNSVEKFCVETFVPSMSLVMVLTQPRRPAPLGVGGRSFLFQCQIAARCTVPVDCAALSLPSRCSMRPARLCRAMATPTWFGRAPLHAAVISCRVLPFAKARTGSPRVDEVRLPPGGFAVVGRQRPRDSAPR